MFDLRALRQLLSRPTPTTARHRILGACACIVVLGSACGGGGGPAGATPPITNGSEIGMTPDPAPDAPPAAPAPSPEPVPAPSGPGAESPLPEAGPELALDLHLLVDQFGYRPGDPKVAVIRSPRTGFDANQTFKPGATYQVRDALDNRVVHTGTLQPWSGGAVDPSAGDVGWWFDFSAVRTPGRYYVADVEQAVRSATFRVDENVYQNTLKAAVRAFYYQRSGFEKRAPYADACWTDAAAYLGPGQDGEARDINRRDDPTTARDLRGGWFDAGDTNKYVTFASPAVHQLLMAYQDHPQAFTDNFNLPESGNGIPDLIDEVRWQMDWLRRMQNSDGSVLLKVGGTQHSAAAPPSSDAQARYYVGACSSATVAAAAMYAHAAHVFRPFEALAADADDLQLRAVLALRAYQRQPEKDTNCDNGTVLAGDADTNVEYQEAMAVVAAIYLLAETGASEYAQFVKAHYRRLKPYHDSGWSRYDPHMGEALLYYTRLPQADADLRRTILDDKLNDARNSSGIYGDSGDDLYRNHLHAEQYHWGSNSIRARYGNTNADMLRNDLDPARAGQYRNRALGTLHYFHGVNPFGLVYLSNMYPYGATYSANEIFSYWFAPDTRWSNARTSDCGPAPGFLAGGPNASAAENGVPGHLVPPVGQPPQKSYRDWNKHWPEASYAITEPSNVYQAAYVRLLAAFAE